MENTDVIDMSASRRGLHRKVDAGAVKGRLVAAAMAVGATAAAAYSIVNATDRPPPTQHGRRRTERLRRRRRHHRLRRRHADRDGRPGRQRRRAQRGTRQRRRLRRRARRARGPPGPGRCTSCPPKGVWTSGFGYRWGVLHAGIDIANSIGTPIVAAADGVVTDVGPTAGYGAWVKIRHSDGTVTLYGHVNTWLVSVGERVMAGDQIATIGNRGNSTGPHLHFSVLKNGTDLIDPVPWLAAKGLSPGNYVG